MLIHLDPSLALLASPPWIALVRRLVKYQPPQPDASAEAEEIESSGVNA